MAVVPVISKFTSRDPLLSHFLRCLFFHAAYYKFQFSAVHIPGASNTAAEALSRNNLTAFSLLVPQVPLVEVPYLFLRCL